jgi:hypothetical protein
LDRTGSGSSPFQRLNYCAPCWIRQERGGAIYWKGALPENEGEEQPIITDEALLAFFDKLRAEPGEEERRLAYFLALTLMRRKVFKLESAVRRGTEEVLSLTRRKGEEAVVLTVPVISSEELEGIRLRLMEILGVTPKQEAAPPKPPDPA